MFSSSRYLATVRRERVQPSRSMSSQSFWSESGLRLSSPAMSFFSRALAASGEAASPLAPEAFPRLREKK